MLDEVEAAVEPGVTTAQLDAIAEQAIRKRGDAPAFLGYQPPSAPAPYPATLCVAPNDVVVHGIPTRNPITLHDGDMLGIDTGLWHEGMIVDAGRTVAVGEIDATAHKLIEVTRGALLQGIKAARPGNRVGDIGYAVSQYVKPYGFGVVEVLCGHGVGYAVHEDPHVPNYGSPGTGAELAPGMVLAIEPMINEGSKEVLFEDDGYTVRTKDGQRSAHFEHTILITDGEPEILTK